MPMILHYLLSVPINNHACAPETLENIYRDISVCITDKYNCISHNLIVLNSSTQYPLRSPHDIKYYISLFDIHFI